MSRFVPCPWLEPLPLTCTASSLASSSMNERDEVAGIIGGVIGGALVLLILVTLLCHLRRRRRLSLRRCEPHELHPEGPGSVLEREDSDVKRIPSSEPQRQSWVSQAAHGEQERLSDDRIRFYPLASAPTVPSLASYDDHRRLSGFSLTRSQHPSSPPSPSTPTASSSLSRPATPRSILSKHSIRKENASDTGSSPARRVVIQMPPPTAPTRWTPSTHAGMQIDLPQRHATVLSATETIASTGSTFSR